MLHRQNQKFKGLLCTVEILQKTVKLRNWVRSLLSIRESSTLEKQVFGTFKNTFELFKAAESLNLQSFKGKFLSCKMKTNISIVNKT